MTMLTLNRMNIGSTKECQSIAFMCSVSRYINILVVPYRKINGDSKPQFYYIILHSAEAEANFFKPVYGKNKCKKFLPNPQLKKLPSDVQKTNVGRIASYTDSGLESVLGKFSRTLGIEPGIFRFSTYFLVSHFLTIGGSKKSFIFVRRVRKHCSEQISPNHSSLQEADVMILKIFFPKPLAKILAFFCSNYG
jgi:hypothetical protein